MLTQSAAVLPGLLQGVQLLPGRLQLRHQLRDLLPERGVLLLKGEASRNTLHLTSTFLVEVTLRIKIRFFKRDLAKRAA